MHKRTQLKDKSSPVQKAGEAQGLTSYTACRPGVWSSCPRVSGHFLGAIWPKKDFPPRRRKAQEAAPARPLLWQPRRIVGRAGHVTRGHVASPRWRRNHGGGGAGPAGSRWRWRRLRGPLPRPARRVRPEPPPAPPDRPRAHVLPRLRCVAAGGGPPWGEVAGCAVPWGLPALLLAGSCFCYDNPAALQTQVQGVSRCLGGRARAESGGGRGFCAQSAVLPGAGAALFKAGVLRRFCSCGNSGMWVWRVKRVESTLAGDTEHSKGEWSGFPLHVPEKTPPVVLKQFALKCRLPTDAVIKLCPVISGQKSCLFLSTWMLFLCPQN